MKKNLLLVDSDSKSLRMLEISLRKAGFSLTTAVSASDAREKISLSTPDLVITETRLPDASGLDLVKQLKEDPKTERIPMIFLSSEDSIEQKVRGLELGVEDYLTKPIYLKEVLTRVRILLDKLEKETVERRERSATFSGLLGEMGLVDLVQTVEIGRKTGRIFIETKTHKGEIAFTDGKVVDAQTGRLSGERAFYRMLVWSEGAFNMEFGAHDTADVIELSTQGLLMEGMRRVDEWGRLLEQLPPLERAFEIDYAELVDRLAEIPDEINGILRLFDGHRSLLEVVDDSDFGDLEALEIASKLYFEGLIYDVETRDDRPTPRETAIEKWLDEDDPAPITPEETHALPEPIAVAATDVESSFELAPPRHDDAEEMDGPTAGDIELDEDEGWEDVQAPEMNETEIDLAPPPHAPAPDELAEDLGLSASEVAALAMDAPTEIGPAPDHEGRLEAELNAAFRDEPDAEPVSADALVRREENDDTVRNDLRDVGEVSGDGEVDVIADAARKAAPTVPARKKTPPVAEEDSGIPPEFRTDESEPSAPVATLSDDGDFSTYEDALPSTMWRNVAGLAMLGLLMFFVAYGYVKYVAPAADDGPVVAEGTDDGAAAGGTKPLAEPSVAPTPGTEPNVPGEGDLPEAEPAASDDPAVAQDEASATDVASPPSNGAATTKTAAGSADKAATPKAGAASTAGAKKPAPKADASTSAKSSSSERTGKLPRKAEDTPDPSSARFAAALNKATAAAKRGKHKTSIKHFKAALRANGKSSAAHLGLANAYYELNSLPAAMVHAEQARALSPNDPQVYVLLGAVYQSSSKISKAIGAYQKYLKLAPNGRFAKELKNILASLKDTR